MPVILKLTYDDGSSGVLRYPAELWVRDSVNCSKLIISEKVIQSVELDPDLETADVDRNNNYFPPRIKSSRFKLFQDRQRSQNEMQKAGLGKKEDEKKSEAPKVEEKAQP